MVEKTEDKYDKHMAMRLAEIEKKYKEIPTIDKYEEVSIELVQKYCFRQEHFRMEENDSQSGKEQASTDGNSNAPVE